MIGDAGVEQRLREGWLVALVVAPAPIADQVNQEILVEALPVGMGQCGRGETGLRIVGVDVHDRDLEALGEVAGVEGGARLVRRRS